MASDLLAGAAWNCTSTAAGAVERQTDLLDHRRAWWPAEIPGTAASSLRDSGVAGWERLNYDASDWWFTTSFRCEQREEYVLDIGGIATIAEVWLDGVLIWHGENMFLPAAVRREIPAGQHDLAVCCRALAPELAGRRARPRWRTNLVEQQNLRYFRTTLLGRMPGWSSTSAPVGPWRPLALLPVRDAPLAKTRVHAGCVGASGRVRASVELRFRPRGATLLRAGDHAVEMTVLDGGDESILASAELEIPQVRRWWPHTHGVPYRYAAKLEVDGVTHELGLLGFRTVEVDRRGEGFALSVNGVPVFCRGACWVPPDPVRLWSDEHVLRQTLESLRDMNANMVRVPGTMAYESDAFLDLCDELGLLVWQDCMFANMDPPDDPEFVASVAAELDAAFGQLQRHACVAVVSGGSEVEQQAAMAGAAREAWVPQLMAVTIPEIVAKELPGVAYVTSTPTGGDLPFSTDSGVAHYFGVGAYLRPLEDARRAGVRFAAECLAFSIPPERESVDQAFAGPSAAGHGPAWKAGVPRDASASWDFEDVTSAYVERLFGVDPLLTRYGDAERALDLGRAATLTCIEQTLGEWRSVGSSCRGAIVLSARDLVPGAGWGLIDAFGRPKAAWYGFRRAGASRAVIVTDEGLSGSRIHVTNDQGLGLDGRVRIELYSQHETLVDVAEHAVTLGPHASAAFDVAGLFPRFIDVTYAYRFGPPEIDALVATLFLGQDVIAEAVQLTLGPTRQPEHDLGLEARGRRVDEHTLELELSTRRLAEFVSFEAPGYLPDDAWFHLAPGRKKVVRLRSARAGVPARPVVHALNAAFAVRATMEEPALVAGRP